VNIRATAPIQFDIVILFKNKGGHIVKETVRYGYQSEPSTFKVKLTARNLTASLMRTIPGLTFVSYEAKRV
jgi:hypothetical protein